MQSALVSLYGAQANSLLGSGLWGTGGEVPSPFLLAALAGTTATVSSVSTATLGQSPFVSNFPFNLTPGPVSAFRNGSPELTFSPVPEALPPHFCRTSRSPASRT